MPQNVNNFVGWTLTRPRGAELTKNLLWCAFFSSLLNSDPLCSCQWWWQLGWVKNLRKVLERFPFSTYPWWCWTHVSFLEYTRRVWQERRIEGHQLFSSGVATGTNKGSFQAFIFTRTFTSRTWKLLYVYIWICTGWTSVCCFGYPWIPCSGLKRAFSDFSCFNCEPMLNRAARCSKCLRPPGRLKSGLPPQCAQCALEAL